MDLYYATIQEAYEGMTKKEQQEFLKRQIKDRARELQEDDDDRKKAGYDEVSLLEACTDGF